MRQTICLLVLSYVLCLALLSLSSAKRPDEYYTPVPRPDPIVRTSPFMLGRGILHHGNLKMVRHIAQKLDKQECLHIDVFGCSVTCGVNVPDPSRNTWAAQLVSALNYMYPCVENGTYHTHYLDNHCIGATATKFAANLWAGTLDSVLNKSDLVFADFSGTDVYSVLEPGWDSDGIAVDPQTGIKAATETFLSMILRTANHNDATGTMPRHWTGIAAILLVSTAAAWLDNHPVHWTGDPYNNTLDTSYLYLPIAQHYGVPLLSTMDVLGPFPDNDAQFYFHNAFMADFRVHPHATGHRLTADLIMYYIKVLMESWRVQMPWEKPPLSFDYNPPRPLLIDQTTLRIHLDARPFQLRLRVYGMADENPQFWLHMTGSDGTWEHCALKTSCCPGWVSGEHPKSGFISYTVNSTCSWIVSSKEVAEHMKFNEMHVTTLKSYEHMGIMGITAYAVGAPECRDSSVVLPAPQVLGNGTIDGLWTERMSLGVNSFVKMQPAPPGTCIRVNITVLPTSRAENKVKFLGFALF